MAVNRTHYTYQPSLEPEQTQHSTNTDVIFEDIGNWHPSIEEFFSSLITDARKEGSWFSNESQLLSPLVVHGDGRWLHLGLRDNQTLTHQLAVYLTGRTGGKGETEGGTKRERER